MTFRFAICEDEQIALTAVSGILVNKFSEHGVTVKADTYAPEPGLTEALCAKAYDAIFLDINMLDCDGVKVAEELRANGNNADIVFVSGAEDRVFGTFSVHPYGFIRKHKFLEDIDVFVKMYMSDRFFENESEIEFKVNKSILRIRTSDIVYVESVKEYQYVYTENKDKPEKLRESMKTMEERLAPLGFIRVHEGYLVNYRHIMRLGNQELVTTAGKCIPISRRRLQYVREEYMKLSRTAF